MQNILFIKTFPIICTIFLSKHFIKGMCLHIPNILCNVYPQKNAPYYICYIFSVLLVAALILDTAIGFSHSKLSTMLLALGQHQANRHLHQISGKYMCLLSMCISRLQ